MIRRSDYENVGTIRAAHWVKPAASAATSRVAMATRTGELPGIKSQIHLYMKQHYCPVTEKLEVKIANKYKVSKRFRSAHDLNFVGDFGVKMKHSSCQG